MIEKSLILKIFEAAYMQRWNDKIRPMDIFELDKQGHKMFIAYFLGKFQEKDPELDWSQIIEGGIFELLYRIVITDLKPSIFYKIKANPIKHSRLNQWVYQNLEEVLKPLGKDFLIRFQKYFEESDNNVNKRILSAAHVYSSFWEYNLLLPFNQNAYDKKEIEEGFQKRLEQYYDLEGMKQLALYQNYRQFIDLCGQLRFQYRWSNLHRVPKTSVLGHSLFVAVFSYFFSIEEKYAPKRIYNNFFTGLFHDLPEILTRDVISPVKRSVEGMEELIKEYEKEQLEKWIYSLLPPFFIEEIRLFAETEFENSILENGSLKTVSLCQLNEKYNLDRFSPRDGKLVKEMDELAAFIEAYEAVENGATSPKFKEAYQRIREKTLSNPTHGAGLEKIYHSFINEEVK
ncbi:MAG TPA: hydrolase [Spirochaetia bacterium]|nr:MAG: hydrolase [Spirochaetes bacterium GWB1_36_13]HCL57985.1 hydrolase [Spirochaetia bacterium]